MTGNPSPAVLISEVGPRDGLQSVKRVMLTAMALVPNLRGAQEALAAIAARAPLMAGLPVYGMTPQAGLPKGFVQGAAHA